MLPLLPGLSLAAKAPATPEEAAAFCEALMVDPATAMTGLERADTRLLDAGIERQLHLSGEGFALTIVENLEGDLWTARCFVDVRDSGEGGYAAVRARFDAMKAQRIAAGTHAARPTSSEEASAYAATAPNDRGCAVVTKLGRAKDGYLLSVEESGACGGPSLTMGPVE